MSLIWLFVSSDSVSFYTVFAENSIVQRSAKK